MAHDVAELRRAERRVQRVQHGARLQCRERRDEILDRVAERERDAVAAHHAERRERTRRRVRQPVELCVAHRAALVQDERVRAARGDVAGEGVEDRVAHYARVPQSATSTAPTTILASSEAR